MNEQELIDLVIVERIDMLLRQKEAKKNCEEESPYTKEAESILRRLPKKEWDILNRYIELQGLQGLQMAENESYLYSCGIADGIRMMKYIEKL